MQEAFIIQAHSRSSMLSLTEWLELPQWLADGIKRLNIVDYEEEQARLAREKARG